SDPDGSASACLLVLRCRMRERAAAGGQKSLATCVRPLSYQHRPCLRLSVQLQALSWSPQYTSRVKHPSNGKSQSKVWHVEALLPCLRGNLLGRVGKGDIRVRSCTYWGAGCRLLL